MAWYRAGTVTVSNGSNVVTGTGTQWANNVHVGDTIVLGSPPQLYEVANVASNTTIGLVTNYTGTSGSGQSYFILATQGWIKELADRAAAVISTYASIEQVVDDLELITTLISQADAQAGTRTDVQGWSSLRVRQAANAAITAQKVSSLTDTTPNRLLVTGSHGLGGIPTVADDRVNPNPNPTGFIQRQSAAAGNPFGAVGGAGISTSIGGGYGSELLITQGTTPNGGSSLSARTWGNDGAWGRWTTILTDDNSLMLGTTAETARAAIQSSVFPAHSKAAMPPIAASINMGVIVSDAVGGRRPFWSDGTNWRDATGTILS